jgi:hypothetical protein
MEKKKTKRKENQIKQTNKQTRDPFYIMEEIYGQVQPVIAPMQTSLICEHKPIIHPWQEQ